MHFKHMTPMIFKQLLSVFQTSAPVRLQGVYVINVPNYLELFHKTLLSFVSPKLAKRVTIKWLKKKKSIVTSSWKFIYFQQVHLFSDAKSMHENIPIEILPKEYGGCQESINVLHSE